MTLKELIERLESADRADRVFDGAIGTILGWRRKVENVSNDSSGETRKRVLWVVPSTNDTGTVPHFTTSLDAAIELMETIARSDTWGVSFADGMGTALIGSGPYCVAPTPPMALCIAALRTKLMREDGPR
jgi:hypothetical protein